MTYASESALTPNAVIEGELKYFLALDTTLSNELDKGAEAQSLPAALPSTLQSQAIAVRREDRDILQASD